MPDKDWLKDYGGFVIGLAAFAVTTGTLIYGAGILGGTVRTNTQRIDKNDDVDGKQWELIRKADGETRDTKGAAIQNARDIQKLTDAVDQFGGLVDRMRVEQAKINARQATLQEQTKEVLDEIRQDLKGRP